MAVIHDMVNTEFTEKDDIVTEIGKAVLEYDELEKEKTELAEKVSELESDVNNLKVKNLELLAMIPTVKEETKDVDETKEVETTDISELYNEF